MVAKRENVLMRKVERAKESSGRRELRYILNDQREKRGNGMRTERSHSWIILNRICKR